MAHGSDIAFTDAVKQAQEKYGVRALNEQVIANRAWGKKITEELAKFIAQRDSFYLGTANSEGQPYIQHRGGARGFLKVIDPTTLAFADYPGNKQFISAGNLSENPRAFIFLMDYETRQRIKMWGRARFVEDDNDLLVAVHSAGESNRAVEFKVETWDVNCPQNIPQRFSEETVTRVVEKLTQRVAELEAQLAAVSG
ncbi:MAG: pyridoxamine 5'-phosphate oxidase family protein [Pseudomonadota bacterium]